MRFSERYRLRKEFEVWIKTVSDQYQLENCLMNGITFLQTKYVLVPKTNQHDKLTDGNKTYECSYIIEVEEC